MNNDSSTTRLVSLLRVELSRLQPGERLPSTRKLVDTHKVSPITVTRALAALGAEGLVVTRPGTGTFVAQPPTSRTTADHSWQTIVLGDRSVDTEYLVPLSDPLNDESLISLGTGYLHPSLLPTKALGTAMARAARLPDAWDRPPVLGLRPLRSWFAQSAGPGIDLRDVLITSGGQGAITTILRALVPAGESILVESPTYPGALAVARAAGIRPVPVPTDSEGVIPEHLSQAFARTGARAFYVQPTYQNPTGAVLSTERRERVLTAAADAGAFVIEDDFARWLSHESRTPPPLLTDDSEGRVVYITSLTKVASGSLRIGAVIARGPVSERIRSLRLVDDMFVPRPTQEATLELVSRAGWARHLHDLSESLSRRSELLATALIKHVPAVSLRARPSGGMHLWVRLPPGFDDVEVAMAARQGGVVVIAGRPFFAAEAPAPYLRLTCASAPTELDLEVGVRRLAAAVPGLTS
jgi:DNA-binding transcriptional MocR family regulator